MLDREPNVGKRCLFQIKKNLMLDREPNVGKRTSCRIENLMSDREPTVE